MKEAERQRKWSDGTVGNDSNAKAAEKIGIRVASLSP